MLWEEKLTDCVLMIEKDIPDGIGGNWHEWESGESFKAAIVKNASPQLIVAEKPEVKETYTVTFRTGPLNFHSVFKRIEDGAIFRVTSNEADSTPPERSMFHFHQVTAERWVLA